MPGRACLEGVPADARVRLKVPYPIEVGPETSLAQLIGRGLKSRGLLLRYILC